MEKKPIIISVGGSLIIPAAVDSDFLKKFRELLLRHIQEGERFVIIAGGGKTARIYQEGLRNTIESSSTLLDWVGIYATHLNARLMHLLFSEVAYPSVIEDPTQPIEFTQKVLIAAGWKPGCSTDHDAVLLAKNLGAKKLINLSNIDYVYDKDPNKYPDAKKIEDVSWAEFRKIIPEKWDPGLNAPFDPVASKEAEALGLEVFIMNGKNLDNLDSAFRDKAFLGTRIH